MNRRLPVLTAAALTALALAGCASSGGSPAAAPSSQAAASAVAAASALATASAAPCLSRKCIAKDAGENLVGLVAQDESVSTKAVCEPSTVVHNAGNTWTVACTVTYSDGTSATGYANILPASGKITFEPAG